MTAALLAVTLLLVIGTTARLTRLITDDVITAPLRHRITAAAHQLSPKHRQHTTDLAQYNTDVQTALDHGTPIPNPPEPPEDHWITTLTTCRWCAGLWTSLLVVTTARVAMTSSVLPLWTGLPLAPVDLLTIPAATLATSYAVGWLAEHE